MKKILTVALAATALVLAPPASASRAGTAITATVAWGGTNCINIMSPTEGMQDTVIEPACAGPGYRLFGYQMALTQRGEWYGLNPYMGDATWLSCSVSMNGTQVDYQMATAGDGNQVDCLRRL